MAKADNKYPMHNNLNNSYLKIIGNKTITLTINNEGRNSISNTGAARCRDGLMVINMIPCDRDDETRINMFFGSRDIYYTTLKKGFVK